MPDNDILQLADTVLSVAREQKMKLATVESCTGGLVAGALTAIGGCSDVFERGWITYSNAAKASEVGVAPELITSHGAVSAQVAQAMAEGALRHAPVDLALAVTGVAGPGGGSDEKPVGLVWIAAARTGVPCLVEKNLFTGDRTAIRQQAIAAALRLTLRSLSLNQS